MGCWPDSVSGLQVPWSSSDSRRDTIYCILFCSTYTVCLILNKDFVLNQLTLPNYNMFKSADIRIRSNM